MQGDFGEFFEDVNDTLRHVVRALGGVKQVGAMLWPEVAPDQAGNKLRDCLNPDRREKLSPEQFVFLLRKAREAGYHAGMEFVANECGYGKPTPVDPEDQLAELQRRFVDSVDTLTQIQAQMNRLQVRRVA